VFGCHNCFQLSGKKWNQACGGGGIVLGRTKHEMNNILFRMIFLDDKICVCVQRAIGRWNKTRTDTDTQRGCGGGTWTCCSGRGLVLSSTSLLVRSEWRMNNGPPTGRNTFATGRFVHVNVAARVQEAAVPENWFPAVVLLIFSISYRGLRLVTTSESGREVVWSLSGPALENKIPKLFSSFYIHLYQNLVLIAHYP